MIQAINVYPRLFGGPMRAGDMIAACNLLEYIREDHEDPTLRLYVPNESVFDSSHCRHMLHDLKCATDYFAGFPDQLVELQVRPGTDPTYSDMYNLWNIREDVMIPRQNVFTIPDAVVIRNGYDQAINIRNDNKVVIAPLLDAPYNHERNWSIDYTQKLLNYYCFDAGLEIIIASKEPIPFNIGHAKYCHNYQEILQHIRDCGKFIGGDTGLSHYASALVPGPYCEFHYSRQTYGTTCPFYWKTKHKMVWY